MEKIVAIGTSDLEYHAIFGQRANQSQLRKFIADADTAQARGFKRMSPGGSMSAQALRQFNNSTAHSFIFVGHNNRVTGNFMFGDGSSIPISKMTRRLGGPVPVILSCRSNEHIVGGAIGLDDTIPYDFAYDLASSYERAVGAQSNPAALPISRLQEILMTSFQEIKAQRRDEQIRKGVIYVAIPLTGAGTVTVGVSLLRVTNAEK